MKLGLHIAALVQMGALKRTPTVQQRT